MEQLATAPVRFASEKGIQSIFWVWTGRLWNFNLGAYNVRTLTSENSLDVLFEEQVIVIEESEVRRTGEELITFFCDR